VQSRICFSQYRFEFFKQLWIKDVLTGVRWRFGKINRIICRSRICHDVRHRKSVGIQLILDDVKHPREIL